jgi:hypothetical protein
MKHINFMSLLQTGEQIFQLHAIRLAADRVTNTIKIHHAIIRRKKQTPVPFKTKCLDKHIEKLANLGIRCLWKTPTPPKASAATLQIIAHPPALVNEREYEKRDCENYDGAQLQHKRELA